MTLKQSAAYVAPNNFPNAVEVDRQVLDRITKARPGFADFNSFAPTMVGRSLRFAEGDCWLRGTNSVDQGMYFAYNDSTVENLALPAAQSSPFIASVLLRVQDSQYGAVPIGESQGTQYKIVSGTPAANPVAPSDADVNSTSSNPATWRPGPWERICDVRINPGDTASIPQSQVTDRRRISVGLSAPLSGTDAQRLSISSGLLLPGTRLFTSDTKADWMWDGSQWVQQNRKSFVTTGGSVTLTTGFQNILLLSNLPIGKYLIHGRFRLEYSIAASGRDYSYQLASGGGGSVYSYGEHIAQGPVGRLHISTFSEVEFTTSANSTGLQGKMDATGGTSLMFDGKIMAIPVDY